LGDPAQVSHDRQNRILNVDIGGGTTKLAIAERGRVVATAAMHIGGRLIAMLYARSSLNYQVSITGTGPEIPSGTITVT